MAAAAYEDIRPLPVCVLLVLAERYTRWNDALLVAGDSPDALQLQGIAPRPVILKAALTSGALCGFAGWIEVAGSQHRIVDNLTPGYGYYDNGPVESGPVGSPEAAGPPTTYGYATPVGPFAYRYAPAYDGYRGYIPADDESFSSRVDRW